VDFLTTLKAAVDGNEPALEKIHDKIFNVVDFNCMRFSTSKLDGEDNIQECYIKIMNKLHTFNGRSYKSLNTWVKHICVNYSIDQYRKKNNIISGEDISEYINHYSDEEETEAKTYSIDDFIDVIDRLGDKQRMIFNLFVLDGFSHKEISVELNISIDASKSGLYLAKKNLRKFSKTKQQKL